MRALVTGGAGFIGSTLVDRLLAEGHGVDVVDDLTAGSLDNLAGARRDPDHDFMFNRLDVASADVTELVARRRPEVVFHLAARTHRAAAVADPVGDARVNVIGTLRVLEGARRAGTRKVVFATDAQAAATGQEPEPHPHAVAKRSAGSYLASYRQLHDLEYTALALANVYGPRQATSPPTGVVAAFAGRLVAGEACTIDGDGTQTRDFVYVDDAVDALARAAERGSGLTLNVSTGVETSICSLHATIVAATGAAGPSPVYGPARLGEPGRGRVDPGRAAIHLGWRPWTPLADGVAAVVEWLTIAR